MRFTPTLLTLVFSLLFTAAAQASNDDMEKLLAEKGLVTQLVHAQHAVSHSASDLVVNAIGFLGVPYKRGGNTAQTGFDCSGFVRAIYEQSIGLMLPRRAAQQAAATQNIDKDQLRPGDLVFFNTMRRAFSHVGIYVGEGKFIHSPKPGAQVRIESLSLAYWKGRFDGARRVASPTAGDADTLTAFAALKTAPQASPVLAALDATHGTDTPN